MCNKIRTCGWETDRCFSWMAAFSVLVQGEYQKVTPFLEWTLTDPTHVENFGTLKRSWAPFLSCRIEDGCLSLCTRQEWGWFHRGCVRSNELYYQVVCCPVPSTPSSDWVKWEPLFCLPVTGLSIWAQTTWVVVDAHPWRCPRPWMGLGAASPWQGGELGGAWMSHPTQPFCDAVLDLSWPWEAQREPKLNLVLKHHCKKKKEIGYCWGCSAVIWSRERLSSGLLLGDNCKISVLAILSYAGLKAESGGWAWWSELWCMCQSMGRCAFCSCSS